MNQAAQQHLNKAKELIAEGDSFYWKAGLEIVAAQKADTTLSNGEIGEWFGKGKDWVRAIVRHVTTGEPDSSIDWDRGSHGTKAEIRAGVVKLASTDPMVVTEMLDAMPEEQREMVEQAIAMRPDFATAIKASPVARDELLVAVMGTPAEQRERHEEADRRLVGRHPLFGWSQVADGLGTANYGLTASLDALVRLAINSRVDSADDALQVARLRAEKIGRSIHEIEMAWGETPITDKIEELRAESVS